ncbi:MAG TPA: TonB-dependent receptor, partial [Burkholderiaceae bacterium]
VDYVTRMPTQLEGHVKTGYTSQPFDLYNTHATYRAWEASASLGSKSGDWSWWINANHTDSEGQPLTFATRLAASGTAGGAGTPVTGAVPGANSAGQPWYVLGTGTQYHTLQDHLKLKLAYDITPALRASYVLGVWQNESHGRPVSYLRDAAGNAVTSGSVNINDQTYSALTGGDLALTEDRSTHYMHGFSLKQHTQGVFDWEVAASLYDYDRDTQRRNGATNALPAAATGGPGTIADGAGTGWNTLALRGTWRPGGTQGPHIVDFGLQQDSYKLRYATSNIAGNWFSDGAGSLASNVRGNTQLQSLWAQDAWAFAPRWKAVLGARAEHWRASDGLTAFSASSSQGYGARSENGISPKAALSYRWSDATVLKAALGRAVRFPTVGELYGATSTTNSQYINDPNLRPEKSWTGELSAEHDLGNALLRLTYFAENTHDALYSQTVLDPVANRNISRVQNIGRIATQGLEAAYNGENLFTRGLDLNASLTYAHSVIKENAGFVSVPGDTIGKQQPN